MKDNSVRGSKLFHKKQELLEAMLVEEGFKSSEGILWYRCRLLPDRKEIRCKSKPKRSDVSQTLGQIASLCDEKMQTLLGQ